MKKYMLFVILLLFLSQICFAQNSYFQTLTTAGEHFVGLNYQLEWTLGELQTETYEANGISLTQGFQQSNLNKMLSNNVKSELNSTYISAFPNPATNYVLFKIENTEINNLKLCITDILGKTIYDSNLISNNTQIDLTKYKKGVYTFLIKENNKIVKIFKIIRI
jgi:hypothetical protein